MAGNVERIEERIAAACLRCGRRREDVALLAVSKFRAAGEVEVAWAAGLRIFGESRVQEAAGKFAGFAEGHPGAALHFVGGLQRNKVGAAVSLFDCIQSVDRDALAAALAAGTAGRAVPLPVMLELRTGEASKGGFSDVDGLLRVTEFILGCSSLRVCGLMTMAPFTEDRAEVRSAFRRLAAAGRAVTGRFPGLGVLGLSMGMSGDFEIAVEEGSTMLRIGSGIFDGGV